MPAQPSRGSARLADDQKRVAGLELHLRSLEQGDLIDLGAIAIVGTTTSEVTGTRGRKAAGVEVTSITVETESGWYAVLTQDCDIVRQASLEPCIVVAPVLYVPEEEWRQLRRGMLSYRRFPLDPEALEPIEGSAAHRSGSTGMPVVDVRYVSSIDKTALAAHYDQRFPLRGERKVRFADWVGSRFARQSFADPVADTILPEVAARLTSMQRARDNRGANATPAMRVACSCNEWYVRATDRYVEVMGRRDPELAKANGLLATVKAEPTETTWNVQDFDAGAKKLSAEINHRLGGSGFTVKVVTEDFHELSAAAFETYALWVSEDPPPP